MKKTFLLISCIAISTQVSAGGYRVSLQGQKALGMGHAGVAMADSAETVFFNPAAMIQMDSDTEFTGGVNYVYGKNNFQNTDLGVYASTQNATGTPVSLYITHKFTSNLSGGFGLYTPYGSSVEWEKDWVGSHLVNDIDLQAIFLQPTLSYKLNDKVSIGGGPILTVSSVELNRNLSTSLVDENGDRSNVTIEESGILDFGYTLGAFFKISDKLNYGINYRSEIIVESEGDASFNNIPGALSPIFVDGGYKAELPLPAELSLGFAYQLNDKTILAFDYNYTFWDAYESLTVEFDSVADPSRATSANPRNYKNSSIYRIGVQHQTTDKLQLRGGAYYDKTPIRDGYFTPETPRSDAVGVTAGMTWQVAPNFELDVSGLYLYFGEENNSYLFSDEGIFEGDYKVSVWSLGVGISYLF